MTAKQVAPLDGQLITIGGYEYKLVASKNVITTVIPDATNNDFVVAIDDAWLQLDGKVKYEAFDINDATVFNYEDAMAQYVSLVDNHTYKNCKISVVEATKLDKYVIVCKLPYGKFYWDKEIVGWTEELKYAARYSKKEGIEAFNSIYYNRDIDPIARKVSMFFLKIKTKKKGNKS